MPSSRLLGRPSSDNRGGNGLAVLPGNSVGSRCADMAERLEARPLARPSKRPRGSLAQMRTCVASKDSRVEALLGEVERMRATLLAIGTHGHSRIEEIILGGVAGELLHQARAAYSSHAPYRTWRPSHAKSWSASTAQTKPSAPSRSHAISQPAGTARCRCVVALGGKRVDIARAMRRHRDAQAVPDAPVPALVEAASCADLLVVGSRGLHGIRALGSVSERVAHEAACSVLVVR